MSDALEYQVQADTTGHIYPTTDALAFVDAAATAIKSTLVAGKREFALMPYRYGGQYLGFDWIDEAKNSISFVFYPTDNPYPLPKTIDHGGKDIGVKDLTDALLLIRLIAEKVLGHSEGQV